MIVRFEDVITRVTGNVDRYNTDLEYYVGGDQYDSSALTIERRGDLKKDVDLLGFKFHFPFKSGDVLLMARNPHLRKAGQVFFDGLCSDASYILRTKNPGVLLQDFIPILLQRDHFWDFFESHKTGGITFLMNWGMLKTYKFDLPPIEKQREVMEKVWAAYRLKQSYQKLIAATDEMVKSRFIEMQATSTERNVLGDFIERVTPERCGDKDLPVLSVTKEYAMVFQNERFEATIVSRDKSNYIIAPRGYLVQGIHIDESNFGIQNLVDEGIVSPAYKLWKFKNQEAIPELLEYYLRSPMAIKYFNRHFLGATVPRRQVIKKDDFLAMPLNLPKMGIQQEYYSFFRQADKSKFSGFKSRFIELFRDGSYQNVPLGDLCTKITDGSHNPPKGVDESEFMMISSQNVFSDGLDLSDVRFLSKEDFENEDKRTSISKGDVLLTIVGTIGRVYQVTGTEGPIALQRSVAVLKPNDKITSRFLMLSFLYDDDFSKEGRGNAQKGVYLKQLSQYMIKLPSTEKQRAFEVIYQQADKSKFELKQAIEKIDKVMRALMQ